ncbi:MAG: hypothetical protein V3T82_07910 [Nitrospinaceae bacterium]
MATVPKVQRTVSAVTGVSGAGRLSPGALDPTARAGSDFFEAAGELVSQVSANEKALEDRQVEREENEWITSNTALINKDWSKGLIDAKAAAPEGAREFTPKFLKTFDDNIDLFLQDAPSERARRDFKSRTDNFRLQLANNAQAFEARAGRVQRMSSFTGALDDRAVTVSIDSSDQAFAREAAAAAGDLLAAENTWMLPADVTKFRAEINSKLAVSSLQGEIARNPRGVISDITGAKPNDGSIAGHLTNQQRQALLSSARSAVNQRKTSTAIQKNALRLEISDINTIQSAGLDVGAARMNELEKQVDLIGDPKMQGRVRDLQQQGVATKEMRTLRPEQLQNFINDKRASLIGKDASQADAALITTAEDLLGEMNKQLRNDPLIWASRSGQVVDPVGFVGEGAVQSMRARRDMASGFAGDYGIEPRFLTNEDERQLTGILSKANPTEKVQVLANIVSGFGRDATNVFGRVSKSDRLMAHAGGLTVEGPLQAKSAVEIVNGNQSMKDGIDVLPGTSEVNQWTSEYLNGAMSMVPPTLASVIDATKAIYTDRAIKSAPADDDARRDLWEKSMDSALGGFEIDGTFSTTVYGSVGQWNGFGVILPNNVSNAQFTALVNAVTDEDLRLASVGGAAPVINNPERTALTADQFRKARFSSIGEGQYLVDLTNVGVDFVLGSGPSGKYVFDLGKIIQPLTAKAKSNADEKAIIGTDVGGS